MRNLALIFFIGNEDKKIKRISLTNIFTNIFTKLKKLFSIKINPVSIKKLEVDSNLAIHAVKLPYNLDELKKAGIFTRNKINKINKCLLRICEENAIYKCIIPQALPFSLERCEKSGFCGRLVYTAMAVNILEYIFGKKGRSIRDVDIAIIQGSSGALPYAFIRLLSPVVKFVTLVTSERELMEKKIEEVCEETGLAVRISSDVAGVLKSCDVVINYGNLKDFGIKKKVDSNAIVINYGELEENLFESGNTVVKDIDVGLGDKYTGSFDQDLFEFYSCNEIAEIVLVNKAGIGISNAEDLADYKVVDMLVRNFEEEGFYIKEYS